MRQILSWAGVTAALLVSRIGSAQSCYGNGGADLRPSTMVIGQTLTVDLVGPGGQLFVLAISDSVAPTTFPGIGTVCVNIGSPLFSLPLQGILPPGGVLPLAFPLANDPFLVGLLIFSQLAVVNPAAPGGLGLSKTVRLQVAAPDSYTSLPSMGALRALHSGTSLLDSRALIAGGGNGTLTAPVGTNTTELFDPITRTFSAGPPMSVARALHTATRLLDGRVLICGGTDTGGIVTSSCDLFDPATNTISPAAPMSTPRCGHTATLLANGMVLVTGGVTTFQGGSTMLAAVLNTAQTTGILYDPVANSWSNVSNAMAQKRFGHAAVLLDNQQVLIVSGINGGTTLPFGAGDVPTWTPTCSLYDPTTNTFSATGSIATGRAAMGISLLPGGNNNVLVTGGIVSGLLSVPTATSSTQRFNGATWTSAGTLATAVGLHGQVRLNDGSIHVAGGGTGTLLSFTAVSSAQKYVAGSFVGSASLPTERGAHSATVLYDGSVLLAGGSDASGSAIGTAVLYTP